MKRINSFTNFISEDTGDNLAGDLEELGFVPDTGGYFITFLGYGNDGIFNSAIAVFGDTFDWIALNILAEFGLDEGDVDILSLGSIEDIMKAIDKHYENSGENWSFFEYKYVEMTPKKESNYFQTSSGGLLDIGEVIDLGRNAFKDFDSKIFKMRD